MRVYTFICLFLFNLSLCDARAGFPLFIFLFISSFRDRQTQKPMNKNAESEIESLPSNCLPADHNNSNNIVETMRESSCANRISLFYTVVRLPNATIDPKKFAEPTNNPNVPHALPKTNRWWHSRDDDNGGDCFISSFVLILEVFFSFSLLNRFVWAIAQRHKFAFFREKLREFLAVFNETKLSHKMTEMNWNKNRKTFARYYWWVSELK